MAKDVKKTTSKTAPRAMRRGLVVLAIAILWAASNQPDSMTPSSILVWGLGVLTVALFARAGFAVIEPVCKLGITYSLRALQRPMQTLRTKA